MLTIPLTSCMRNKKKEKVFFLSKYLVRSAEGFDGSVCRAVAELNPPSLPLRLQPSHPRLICFN